MSRAVATLPALTPYQIPQKEKTEGSPQVIEVEEGALDWLFSGEVSEDQEGPAKEKAPQEKADVGDKERPSKPPGLEAPRWSIHVNHESKEKARNWSLAPVNPVLFVGASNLSRLPRTEAWEIEVHSFPGATIVDGYNIIKHRTRTIGGMEHVVLAFGLNDRANSNITALGKILEKLVEAAKATFPGAKIYVPLINYDKDLPEQQVRNLRALNDIIFWAECCVPLLPGGRFQVELDKIHWTAGTAQAMLQHWLSHLKNLEGIQVALSEAQAPVPNLPPEEIQALEDLTCRSDIVIKPADKGSAVVIMDRARYVQDTYDFLEKVQSLRVPPDAFLFSLNVESLYTNIETPLGLRAVRDCFARFPDASRPDEAILELLELSLTRNDFEFEGGFYLQIKGTAMGKRFAPAYANIYMAQWEETVFPKCEEVPLSYFRFLDDVWGVRDRSRQGFETFLGVLNAHHASIKVKAVINEQAIEFLDTIVYKGPEFISTGQLDFKMFFKETDTHALLHYRSYHPGHTFRGIVLSQLLRFRRICSREESFQKAKCTLFRALRARGFSRCRLKAIYKEHCRLETNVEPRKRPSRESKVLVPAIFLYTPEAARLTREIRGSFAETLADTPEGKDIKLLAAYKRNTNLRDLLVHSRLPKRKGKLRFLKRKRPQTIKAWGQPTAFFLSKIPLKAENCVYGIQCGKQYVGQTKN
ncbi:hypothetical protein PO909_005132 [Leuciscus waleckii]